MLLCYRIYLVRKFSVLFYDLVLIKQIYQEEFDRNLEEDIAAEASPETRKLIQTLATGIRETNFEADIKTAEKDVAKLIQVQRLLFSDVIIIVIR